MTEPEAIGEHLLRFFREGLLAWYDPAARPLPWKGEKDPYLIWLSEIILQQTRVDQGRPYYERFRSRFPDLRALAAATDDEVMKMWEGLGYYRRAQHMLQAARALVREGDGTFPDTYQGIRSMKGVGPYTAAAIASFAYDLPHAVVDGNVYRVLARFFGRTEPVDRSPGQKVFRELAGRALDPRRPGRFNQAIMDFGATVCTPRSPQCETCPLAEKCHAKRHGTQDAFPVKQPPRARRHRHFHYLVLRHRGLRYLRKRREKDIWQNLYEFPLIEWPRPGARAEDLIASGDWAAWIGHADHRYLASSMPFQQTLSHQVVRAVFHEVDLQSPPRPAGEALLEVPAEGLGNYAFPRIIDWYFRDKSLSLNI